MLDSGILDELRMTVGEEHLLDSKKDLQVYECDALTIFKNQPDAVVLPASTEEVAGIVKLCNREGIRFIPRGAGTSLSGGANPVEGGLVISLARMNKIVETDFDNEVIEVEAGVVNSVLTDIASKEGFFFAPDPSSQNTCTIGGNVAHNAGGAHCLKYGVTSNHVVGLEVVLPDGEIMILGGHNLYNQGYDLLGLILGSEGTLGIVTKVLARIVRKPKRIRTYLAVFGTVEDASNAVSAIISGGLIPTALEMMDPLAIHAVESSKFAAGFPQDVGAILIIEVDGEAEELEIVSPIIMRLCTENGAIDVKEASSEVERKRWWKGRKGAFDSMKTISPSYYVQDGVVPRNKLPALMKKIEEIGKSYSLRIANVFHAGDGNLHPLILYDEKVPGEVEKVIKAGDEILLECIASGGSISGEHGIGIEKRTMMSHLYSPEDLDAMLKIRSVFNPKNLCNPGKIFPSSGACASGVSGKVQKGSW